MSSLPLVSIVMGSYNGREFLSEQMESLLKQDYPALEFIVVDDCSTDGSFEQIQTYAASDGRIKFFRNETNLGYNRNFEKALKLATGDFVAIADQDDRWEHEKISILMADRWKDNGPVMVHSPSALFKTGGEIDWKSTTSRLPFIGNEVRKFFIFNHISGHNMLFRRSLLEKALPFPENFYYDWWLAAVACCNGGISYVDKVLAYHRIHETNASGFTGNFIPFYKHVLQTLPVLLRLPNLPEEDIAFGKELLAKYKLLEHQNYSPALHYFVLRHAATLFSFKKKRLPFFSYLKHSTRISKASFLKKEH